MTDSETDYDIEIDRENGQQPESLSGKVIRGGIWVFALSITNRGLGFIRTIILARLLAPEDFGLLGIAMLAISTLETFSQTGFQTALIQKKNNVESYLDTAWTVSVIRGTVLFLLLFFSAPIVAKFFNSPQAILIIKVIAVSTLLSGFRNIGLLYFQKELEFNKQFVFSLATTLTNLGVSIPLAFVLKNVWALVWGGLSANLVGLSLSYILHPYRPRIVIDKDKFQDLFGFGKWVVGSGILVFLITQGDDIFVGKMLGVTALGFYQMAYMLSNLPATEIAHVISQVTFPAYSKLQNEVERLRAGYLDVLQITTFLSIPLGGIIIFFAPEFTRIFLGSKWIEIVTIMQILAVCGVIRSIGATAGPVFHAVGKPGILTRLVLIKLVALSLFIYPLTHNYGILGTSLAVLGASLISNPVADYMVIKVTNCQILKFLETLLFPLSSVAVMCIVLGFLKFHFRIDTVTKICMALIVGLFIYLSVIWLLTKFFGYKLKKTLILSYNSWKQGK